MTATPPPGLDALAGAAVAAPQQGADPAVRFAPELEAEYVRSRLLDNRTLIRMACLLGLVLTALRIGEIGFTGGPAFFFMNGPVILLPVIVLSSSLLLAWFAWSPSFTARYLPLANIAVPVRNVVAATAITMMASTGQTEVLMLLPAMVLSPFFFLGLHFRPALACVTATVAVFIAAAVLFALPMPVLLRACGFLIATAAISAVCAWLLERQSRRSFLDRRLIAQLAEHDALTGAKNRRVFDAHLERLWQQAIEDGRRLAILLIDVDQFKAYNDCYGHQAGDRALHQVATTAQARISRPLDLMARYGGEEFAVLLYDMDAQQARDLAERMRMDVRDLSIVHRDSAASRVVTVSIGVAAIRPVRGRDPRGAVQLADEALYAAKVGGRDRTHVAEESEYRELKTGIFAQWPAARR